MRRVRRKWFSTHLTGWGVYKSEDFANCADGSVFLMAGSLGWGRLDLILYGQWLLLAHCSVLFGAALARWWHGQQGRYGWIYPPPRQGFKHVTKAQLVTWGARLPSHLFKCQNSCTPPPPFLYLKRHGRDNTASAHCAAGLIEFMPLQHFKTPLKWWQHPWVWTHGFCHIQFGPQQMAYPCLPS